VEAGGRYLRVDGTVELIERPVGYGTLVMKIGQVVDQLLARDEKSKASSAPARSRRSGVQGRSPFPESLPDDANAKAI
jgi:hypothetical protein